MFIPIPIYATEMDDTYVASVNTDHITYVEPCDDGCYIYFYGENYVTSPMDYDDLAAALYTQVNTGKWVERGASLTPTKRDKKDGKKPAGKKT